MRIFTFSLFGYKVVLMWLVYTMATANLAAKKVCTKHSSNHHPERRWYYGAIGTGTLSFGRGYLLSNTTISLADVSSLPTVWQNLMARFRFRVKGSVLELITGLLYGNIFSKENFHCSQELIASLYPNSICCYRLVAARDRCFAERQFTKHINKKKLYRAWRGLKPHIHFGI